MTKKCKLYEFQCFNFNNVIRTDCVIFRSNSKARFSWSHQMHLFEKNWRFLLGKFINDNAFCEIKIILQEQGSQLAIRLFYNVIYGDSLINLNKSENSFDLKGESLPNEMLTF